MDSILRGIQGPGVRSITGRHTGSTILPETKAFRDRVQSNGGEIEDGALRDLYDPIIKQAKDDGWYSDLKFLSSGSAVENVSGAVRTLFDASGGQNDLIQDTPNQRPAINKSPSTSDGWSTVYGGNDDYIGDDNTGGTQIIPSGSQPTIVSVHEMRTTQSDKKLVGIGDGSGGGSDIDITPEYGVRVYGGNKLFSTSASGSPEILSVRQDGGNVTDFKAWVDGSQLSLDSETSQATSYQEGFRIGAFLGGSGNITHFVDASLYSMVIIDAQLTNTERESVEDIFSDYYG